jgi:hypothetical protein
MAFAPASSKVVLAAELFPVDDCLWLIAADPRGPDKPRVRRLEIPRSRLAIAAELVRRCRLTIPAQEMIAGLCASIVAPLFRLADNADVLIISPCGPLHFLPLPAGAVDGGHTLAESIPVTVLPSTSFIHVLASRRPDARVEGVTILKGPERDSGNGVGAVAEVLEETLLLHFPGIPVRRSWRIRRMKPGEILFVAAHGGPLGLLLRESGGKPAWIPAERFAAAAGRPTLAFLAVCRSLTAEVAEDEEPLGPAWALLAGGAGAIVSGIWEIEAGATASFASRLLDELLGGRTLGEAYCAAATAQRVVYQCRDFRDWAGFVLSGDWRLRLSP